MFGHKPAAEYGDAALIAALKHGEGHTEFVTAALARILEKQVRLQYELDGLRRDVAALRINPSGDSSREDRNASS